MVMKADYDRPIVVLERKDLLPPRINDRLDTIYTVKNPKHKNGHPLRWATYLSTNPYGLSDGLLHPELLKRVLDARWTHKIRKM